MHNATTVYAGRRLDWLMHCDADEFLHPTGDMAGELAASGAHSLRIRNFERVRRGPDDFIFAGSFRRQMIAPDRLAEIYGRWSQFLRNNLTGYQVGKDIVATGHPFRMGIHFPSDLQTRAPIDPQGELASAILLHFDGLTPLHIALKLLKRATEPVYDPPRKFGPQREKQMRFAHNHAAKPKQLAQMLDMVFGIDAAQAEALGEVYHREIGFDPRPALEALGLSVELSVAAFDAELRQREAALIAETGLLL